MKSWCYFKAPRALFAATGVALAVATSAPVLIAVQIGSPGDAKKVPSFADYKIEEIFKGKVARINPASHRWAKQFRTVISEGVSKGPNFAGHFTLVYWGCGTTCQSFAIVDSKSGNVYVPTDSSGNPLLASIGFSFQLDSRLLIVNPIEELEREDPESALRLGGSLYYVWENNRLNHVFTLFPTRTDGAR